MLHQDRLKQSDTKMIQSERQSLDFMNRTMYTVSPQSSVSTSFPGNERLRYGPGTS